MSRPIRIYLASSWRNAYQATVLSELRAAGFEVYDFKNPAPGNQGFGWRQTIDRPIATAADLLEALAHPRAVAGFKFDFDAMKWADVCVLLLPSGNSAHLEAGWMAGQGKNVVVLAPELREPECLDDPDGRTPLFMTTAEVIDHLWRTEILKAPAAGLRAPAEPPSLSTIFMGLPNPNSSLITDDKRDAIAAFARDAKTLHNLGFQIRSDRGKVLMAVDWQPGEFYALTPDEARTLAVMVEAMADLAPRTISPAVSTNPLIRAATATPAVFAHPESELAQLRESGRLSMLEVERMRPVYEAAKRMIPDWHDTSGSWTRVDAMNDHCNAITKAVEAAEAAVKR